MAERQDRRSHALELQSLNGLTCPLTTEQRQHLFDSESELRLLAGLGRTLGTQFATVGGLVGTSSAGMRCSVTESVSGVTRSVTGKFLLLMYKIRL